MLEKNNKKDKIEKPDSKSFHSCNYPTPLARGKHRGKGKWDDVPNYLKTVNAKGN